MVDIIEVDDPKELPVYSIMFPDDLNVVVPRMKKIEEKLLRRGYTVPKPLKIYRRTYKGSTMLSVELERAA